MKFSFETIENFDEHIRKSIPNYDLLIKTILRLSDYFLVEQKNVYDLGCSTGKMLIDLNFTNGYKIGYDKSISLLPKVNDENLIFKVVDLECEPLGLSNACIIYSLFTLQFIRKENRLSVLKEIYNGLIDGGAFFYTEKIYSRYSQTQDIFTFGYYDYKKENFSEKEILDKEKDLRLILRPKTFRENERMLYNAGFKIVEPFYKYFNFAGWLCIK